MKKIFFTLSLTLIGLSSANAQVGIGTSTPQATLDVKPSATETTYNTGDGILIPRVTAIPNAAAGDEGELVYVNGDGFYYNTGGATWVPFAIGGAIDNADLTAGTGGIYKGSGALVAGTTTVDFDTNTANLNFDANTLFIDGTTNRVGVVNSSPNQALDVAGNVQFSQALMPAGQAGVDGQILASTGAGTAPIWKNSTEIGSTFVNGGSTDFSASGVTDIADFYFIDKLHTIILPTMPNAAFRGKVVRLYIFGGTPADVTISPIAADNQIGTIPTGMTYNGTTDVLNISGNNLRFQFIDIVSDGNQWFADLRD